MLKYSTMAVMIGLLIASPALADKPSTGKSRQARGSDGISVTVQINASEGAAIRDYYGAVFARGACPPGLAKKNNGCMPPGQAKKWARGQPLSRDIVFHELPRDLLIRLNAPAGTRYVRVAADILLIAVGTGMVLDAIEDLSRI